MATLRAEAGVSGGIAPGSVSADNLTQEVTLVTNSIKSSDYVPGVLGWNISGTGVAEFSNIYVRGDINAETGTIGYWNISSPGVERTIGGRQLFGTFLESADFGASDDDVDTGVYVGLFKSYFEDSVPVTGATRLNNVVTITSPSHGYLNGDFVIVDIDNDSTNMYGTGSSPVRIIEVSKDTFKYQNSGTDTVYVDGSGNFVDHNVTGTATLYVKDVAGLYLQDYGKALFDYGYFSNEGISYVSAETPNLVYNASFEYINSVGTAVFSADSWVAGTLTPTSYIYSSTNTYNGDSTYGAKLQWTSTGLSTHLMSTVNAFDFKRLDFYKNNRELYLSFDAFFVNSINQVTIPTTGSFVTTSASIITITCPGHGLSVNDLVFLDFNVTATGYVNYTGGFRIHTVLSVSGDSFTIENKEGTTTANPITLSARWSANPCIFKYTQPILDLNDVKIGFVTDTSTPTYDLTTSIYDVLTDVTIANWDDYKYWSISSAEFESWYFIRNSNPYRRLNSMGVVAVGLLDGEGSTKQVLNVKISSSKLEAKYRAIAGVQYSSDVDFYLCFPEWVWEGTEAGPNTAPTKRNVKAVNSSGIGYILDNVSLSPSKKFFYGDSGSDSFYYKLIGDDVSKTNKVSYEAPRQWLDVDLDSQTAELKYMDLIEFKSSDFLKQLFINPGINTVKEYSTIANYSGDSMLIGESSVLNISSGVYKYLVTGSTYRDVQAYSSLETGTTTALASMYAVSSTENINGPLGKSGAGMFMSVGSDDSGRIEMRSDIITLISGANILQLASSNGRLSTSATETSLSSRTNSMGVRISSTNAGLYYINTMYFGLAHNGGSPKVLSFGINNNQLTSNYSSVAISTFTSELGYISSSITTKKNIEPLELTIDSILSVEPVQFNYKSEEDSSPKHAGFIAEQLVEAGLNDYVSFDESGNPVTVNYDRFVSALQSVVRHQATQIADLNSRLSALEGN
jgi:hypothetical protein